MADDPDGTGGGREYEAPALQSLGKVDEVTSVSDEKTVSTLEE